MMEEYIVQTHGLCKSYNKKNVLDSVDMHVKKGEIYGLIGKNGAGKTTIMKILCGLIYPTKGRIQIGNKCFENSLVKCGYKIGNILETPAFFPYLTARDNLEYYRIQKGIPEKECVDELLRFVSLSETGNKKFKTFSLGMKQRLGFAYALMNNPDILILDEPTNGLDPQGIIDFRKTILKLAKEKQITVIISTHILSELSQLADTYGFIKEGHMIEEVEAATISERCKHHLLIKAKESKLAVTILEQQLNTHNYEVLENGDIKLFEYLDMPEIVIEALVNGKAKICSLQEVKGNLEEYYMKIMGDMKNA